MRAYLAQLNADSELREFVPEDALPNEVLSDLLREFVGYVQRTSRKALLTGALRFAPYVFSGPVVAGNP